MSTKAEKELEVASSEWAAGLEGHFLHCRELGHSWDHYTASYDAKARAYDRVLMCASCHTERHQVLDSTGEVVINRYHYPAGYLAKGFVGHVGGRGIPRRTFRLAALKRVTGR